MDTKIDKTPRQLAREYYNGLLSFAEYRDLRRRVIDDITHDDATRPLEQPSAPAVTVREAVPRSSAADTPAAGRSKAGLGLLSVVGLVIAGAIVGWLVLSGDGGRQPVVDDEPSLPAADIPAPETAGTAVPALDAFLAADDWSYDALAGLTLAWSALREQEQQAARGSPSFRTLSERLRERVLEQRALRDVDSDAIKHERVLLSLAQQLGVAGLEFASALPATSEAAGSQESTAAPGTAESRVAEAGEAAPETARTADEPVEAAVAGTTPDAAGPPVARVATGQATPEAAETPERPARASAPADKAGDTTPAEQVTAPVDTGSRAVAAKEAVTAPKETATAPEETPTAPVQAPPAGAQPAAADACPASLARTRRPICRDALADGSKGPLMVVLPAGSFRMGSGREASEQPVHPVTIARSFAISAYEVSVAQYRRFCKASGRHCVFAWPGDNAPAVNVSWKDAQSYTHWLSSATGKTYRLPTEAEWEYAARGGTTGDYPFGDGSKVLPSDARFEAAGPLPVNDRSVNVNGFRLRHIIGNVREWVADAWFDNYRSVPKDGRARTSSATPLRVVRGGSFADSAYRLRASAREALTADTRDNRTGFRLVREINNR